MLTESDKQVATQAVSRFGADRARVFETLVAVRRAVAQGQPANFLDALVERRLLTPAQAGMLRHSLADTHMDLEHRQLAVQAPPVAPGPKCNGAVPCDAEDLIGPSTGLDLRVVGEYRILALLGEGGMGAVYRAYHEAEDRYVAIKVLADHLARNQNYLERFHREAQSVARLNHPNIVRSLGAGHDAQSGKHYLVLEYVDGENAQALLDRLQRLSVGDAVHIALEIARALEHAHSRRIVHRDIKPDNILLTRSGTAKLSDLGLAKEMGEANSLTATRQGFGTPYYMPYEQSINARKADGRSDIFALGATLYHMLTGELPFPGESPLAIVEKKERGPFAPAGSHCPGIPDVLEDILAKMMARDPRDRYQSVSELIVALDRSGLAALVPSFVNREIALRDPLVRARVTAPAQPTQPDLSMEGKNGGKLNGATDLWFLRFRNREGKVVRGKLATEEVRKRLEKGGLTLNVQAARAADGKFQPLAAYPEFQNVEREERQEAPASAQSPAPAEPPEPPAEKLEKRQGQFPESRWTWLVGVGVAAGAAVGGLIYWYFFST